MSNIHADFLSNDSGTKQLERRHAAEKRLKSVTICSVADGANVGRPRGLLLLLLLKDKNSQQFCHTADSTRIIRLQVNVNETNGHMPVNHVLRAVTNCDLKFTRDDIYAGRRLTTFYFR